MSKNSYFEKLKDPRWQRLRLEVMQAANFACERCFDAESTLNVHHKIYWHGNEPWEYDRSELACLCESCHEEVHHGFDCLKWICTRLAYDGPFNRDEAAFVIAGFLAVDYHGVLNMSGLDDIPHRKNLYEAGLKVRDIVNG